MDTVSVIVPTYNQERYLLTCLDSIWFQDYPDLEIIVVDDASTDGTKTALEAFATAVTTEQASFASRFDEVTGTVQRTWHPRYPQQGRRLIRLTHDQNQGLSAALNTGLRTAGGTYCTFIASDDMLLPSMISELHAALLEHQADFAYADMHIVDDAGRILRRFALPEYSFETAFCDWYLCGVCKLYKRELHARHGVYNVQSVAQDHDMYLRFALGGAKFIHVPRVLANVRIHDQDRKVGNHTPQQESGQRTDSIRLARLARLTRKENTTERKEDKQKTR